MESRDHRIAGGEVSSAEVFVVPELEKFVGESKYKMWTDHDERVLKAYYGKVHVRRLAEQLDRTIVSVQQKATRLGITNPLR